MLGNLIYKRRMTDCLPETDPVSWTSEQVLEDQRATFQNETFTSDQSVQENALIYSRQLQKNMRMPVSNDQVYLIVTLVFLLLLHD